MINTKKLIRKLYKLYPLQIAKKNHDFAGLMVSPLPENTSRIVLCLDLDKNVIEQYMDFNPELIITHHPFLYGPSKAKIIREDIYKRDIYNYLKGRCGVVSLHTNFDEAENGMNDVLAQKLELHDVYSPTSMNMMRIGYLSSPLDVEEFASYAKDKLNVSYVHLVSNGKKEIQKVAIIGGGGSYYYKDAQNEGADIYISGDVPHHVRRSIICDNYNYLDVPHEVERVFMNQLKKVLLEIDSSLEILCIDHEEEAKTF